MLAKTKYYRYLILKKPENISCLDPETVDIVITQNRFEKRTFTVYYSLYYRLIDKETGLLIKKVMFGHCKRTRYGGEYINLYSSFI